jgi:regulator of cell morphogenesis and NO signaling
MHFWVALVIFEGYMDNTLLKNKRIAQLVDENYVHAYVLFYFGIRFDE